MKNLLPSCVKATHFIKVLILTVLCFTFSHGYSQEKVITGTVTDAENGEALIGVTVVVKDADSNIGVITDLDGKFKLTVPAGVNTLLISSIGFTSQEISIGNRTTIDVSLEQDLTHLDEVVVTALGVEREAKALGYAVQEVNGDELVEAKEANVLNSLSGRMAGVQVTNGSSGVGSTSLISIRGEGSLIPGNNSPLFVVDGVPIATNNTVSNQEEGNLETDYGNGAQDINPDDIASISVLKGPSASALYGSRGANGVILITTKSGKGQKGIGISYNQSITFETPLRIPKYQNQYGQGLNFEFEFLNGSGGGLNDNIDESWGPLLDGRLIAQHDSPTSSGFRAGDWAVRPTVENEDGDILFTDAITPTPWVAQPDNIESFFETGRTVTTNVSFSGSNDLGDFRVSYTDLSNEGILPNTDYNRRTFALNGSYKLHENIKATASVNYVNGFSNNRPNNSYGTENIMYLWVWFGRQIDMSSLENYWQPGLEGIQQYNYNYNWHDNPYFTMYENTNSFDKDRVFGNLKLDIDITEDLSLMLRSGTDFSNELRQGRRAYSSQRFAQGQYREDYLFAVETNHDFLLAYNKNIDANFQVSVSAGGNLRNVEDQYRRLSANSLSVPGIYSLENAAEPLSKTFFDAQKKVHSLYGFANVSYKNMLFFDVTGRNDWSSTLPSSNWSYFYPSASASAVISDMVQLPTAFSFVKLRAGWAQVGNDTDAFQLYNTYGFVEPWGDASRVTTPTELKEPNLLPELSSSIEFGTDIRLFKGRLGVDLTYYKTNTKNQILSLPVTPTSGFSTRVINAGEIENRGVELMLSATPISLANGFQWNTSINYTRNRGEVLSLMDGLDEYVMSENYLQVIAKVGERMGDVYGTGFEEVSDPTSEYYGQVIHDADGYPITSSELKKLGNYNPDFMVGFHNEFSFKGINLGVLFDWRHGGVVMSRTVLIGGTSGMMDFTVEGREEGIISEGVVENEDGSYSANTVTLSARDYYWSKYNRANEEVGLYDASYLKLREVTVGYTFPKSLYSNLPIQSIRLSAVGRNLALWTENPHFDPETLSFNGGTIVPGVEDMATPSSRSMGFNLNIKF